MQVSDISWLGYRRRQAQNSVRVSLIIAFAGAMLGTVVAVGLGNISGPEAWLLFLAAVVTGSLLIAVYMRAAMATSVITGCLTVYYFAHLNAGAIIAYATTDLTSRTLPYMAWFFPLVVFHHFTNFGFYKNQISVLVNIGPAPMIIFMMLDLRDPIGIATVLSYTVSYFAFVAFIGLFTRHRDQEIRRAARAEETERSASAVRVSEERFRLLSLATNDLVYDIDLALGTVWWNDKLLESYGYDPREFATNPHARENWIHSDDRDRVVEGLRSAIDSGQGTWLCEFRFRCSDGRFVDVVERAMILRDEAGKASRIIGSTTDVSEFNALQKKLQQAHKMEAVGQLTGGLAHDFNNLLTIVIGNAEELSQLPSTDPDARGLAETIMQAAERGAMLTSRLLSFARLQILSPVKLQLGDLLAGMEVLMRRTIVQNIAITLTADADVWPVEVDPSQLENALLNLVINARDAMPQGGEISIRASNILITKDDLRQQQCAAGERYVTITVTDNGCGMPQRDIERAFEPFFTTKEVGKGSGLGLSMVWGFVQQSRGFAEITSELAKGTTVTLYFPASGANSTQNSSPPKSHVPIGGAERILIVEDDDLVRQYVEAQLARLGYTTLAVGSATEAMEIMEKSPPFELLFTDVIMPGEMNGRQLAEAALAKHPELRVLLASGYSGDPLMWEPCVQSPMNFIGKPYRRTELAETIRKILDE
jgi:PAS domain S-box-containing protein